MDQTHLLLSPDLGRLTAEKRGRSIERFSDALDPTAVEAIERGAGLVDLQSRCELQRDIPPKR